MYAFIFGIALCGYTFMGSATQKVLPPSVNAHHLVIIQYHHVSTKTPEVTSVSPETFEAHMAFLSENYNIIDLAEGLQKIQNQKALPDNSVAITFDDGYRNIFENAHPILEKYDFPYTVFINPLMISEVSYQLTWQQIVAMQPLATFANHTLDHAHLLTREIEETSAEWLARMINNVNQAENILETKLGYSKKWIAYPYGEFNSALKEELKLQGYIGFGQHSGVVSKFSDFSALPRFPAAGIYANLDSLETKLNSFAMPVTSATPSDNEFTAGDILGEITLVIDDDDVNWPAFACYFQGHTLPISHDENELVVDVNHKLSAGRTRVNCTAPSKSQPTHFYWYSYPIFTATTDGRFLD
jgi:peptidoglycan/xylan/chitin deacetylase (PgdA/CDA1 family)